MFKVEFNCKEWIIEVTPPWYIGLPLIYVVKLKLKKNWKKLKIKPEILNSIKDLLFSNTIENSFAAIQPILFAKTKKKQKKTLNFKKLN